MLARNEQPMFRRPFRESPSSDRLMTKLAQDVDASSGSNRLHSSSPNEPESLPSPLRFEQALLLGHVAELTEDDELAVGDVLTETVRGGDGHDVITSAPQDQRRDCDPPDSVPTGN